MHVQGLTDRSPQFPRVWVTVLYIVTIDSDTELDGVKLDTVVSRFWDVDIAMLTTLVLDPETSEDDNGVAETLNAVVGGDETEFAGEPETYNGGPGII